MTIVKPNFFLIGAMKCGTTSLRTYLGAHPDIFMSSPKEPTHFVDKEQLRPYWPQLVDDGYWGLASYLDLFLPGKGAKVVGESSTNYSKLPEISGVAERIWNFNNNAKILYIMRDPIERTISHYKDALFHRREHRNIAEAVGQNPHYRAVSHYALQLKPYVELFESKQVKAVTLEELRQSPFYILHEIFDWLSVDHTLPLSYSFEQYNVTQKSPLILRHSSFLHNLRNSPLWHVVRTHAPERMLAVIRRPLMRKFEIKPKNLAEVYDFLRPIQLEQTEELSSLLGRKFLEWRTLYADQRPS